MIPDSHKKLNESIIETSSDKTTNHVHLLVSLSLIIKLNHTLAHRHIISPAPVGLQTELVKLSRSATHRQLTARDNLTSHLTRNQDNNLATLKVRSLHETPERTISIKLISVDFKMGKKRDREKTSDELTSDSEKGKTPEEQATKMMRVDPEDPERDDI